MPESPRTLSECIEAEREAVDAVVACPWGIHEEFLRRKAVMTAARAATDEAVKAVEAVTLTRDEAREILRRIAFGRVTDGSDRLLQPALERVRRVARDESIGGWWPAHGFRHPREVPPHRSGGGAPRYGLGACNCADRTPTVPVYRDAMTHLDDCPAKDTGYPVGCIRVVPAPTTGGASTPIGEGGTVTTTGGASDE